RIIAHESQLDLDLALRLATLGEKVRHLRQSGLSEGVSTRLLVYAGQLIGRGIAPRRACAAAVSRALTDDPDAVRAIDDVAAALFAGAPAARPLAGRVRAPDGHLAGARPAVRGAHRRPAAARGRRGPRGVRPGGCPAADRGGLARRTAGARPLRGEPARAAPPRPPRRPAPGGAPPPLPRRARRGSPPSRAAGRDRGPAIQRARDVAGGGA